MSRRPVITSARADEDVVATIDHFTVAGAPATAREFVDALEVAFDLIAEHPSIGSVRFAIETGIADLRSMTLRRFPYAVFWTDGADALRVHRVLHTRRDLPGLFAHDSDPPA